MNRLRAFYFTIRWELAFLIVLYVWIRLARFDYHPATETQPHYVFDRWTTLVDRPTVTKARFVAEPARP